MAANGGKRNGVRQIVDATLAILGDALQKGNQLNLPPLGRARVTRTTEADGGVTMMVKLRRGGKEGAKKARGKAVLAEANDQG